MQMSTSKQQAKKAQFNCAFFGELCFFFVENFMTQERFMFSNPTPSESRLSLAATMSGATPSSLTPFLHCASILQPAAPPQVVTFES